MGFELLRDLPSSTRRCKNPYDKIELRAGAPLTLDPSRGRFGGMTSSFAIADFPVFYYANAI